MTTSTSRLAFTDCFELFEKALAADKGIRIKFPDRGSAWYFRLRLQSARRVDRQANTETYNPDHKMYGRSVYDTITCRLEVEAGQQWLNLEKIDAREFEIEELGKLKPETEAEEAELPAIEHVNNFAPPQGEPETIKRRI